MKEVCSHLGVFENKEHDGHVHILLKGEHLLSLNKNLRSSPTPVLLIKTLLADRICQLKPFLSPGHSPRYICSAGKTEGKDFPPVTLQLN